MRRELQKTERERYNRQPYCPVCLRDDELDQDHPRVDDQGVVTITIECMGCHAVITETYGSPTKVTVSNS
jgi:hypothetical protein